MPFGFVCKLSLSLVMLISVSVGVKICSISVERLPVGTLPFAGQLRTLPEPEPVCSVTRWKLSGSPAAAGTAGKASRIRAACCNERVGGCSQAN